MIRNISLALLFGTAIVAGETNDSDSISGAKAGWNWAQNV